jgi:hypothetical protein
VADESHLSVPERAARGHAERDVPSIYLRAIWPRSHWHVSSRRTYAGFMRRS